MSLTFNVSTTGNMTLTGIYNFLPLLPILYFLHPQKALSRSWFFPGGVTYNFIPEGSVCFVVLPGHTW